MTVCKSELDTRNILGYPGQILQTLKYRLLAVAGAQVKSSLSWLSFRSNREMILVTRLPLLSSNDFLY